MANLGGHGAGNDKLFSPALGEKTCEEKTYGRETHNIMCQLVFLETNILFYSHMQSILISCSQGATQKSPVVAVQIKV